MKGNIERKRCLLLNFVLKLLMRHLHLYLYLTYNIKKSKLNMIFCFVLMQCCFLTGANENVLGHIVLSHFT